MAVTQPVRPQNARRPQAQVIAKFGLNQVVGMTIESFIDVWHGFGSITGIVSHDGDQGNATTAFVELDFGESQLPTLNIEEDGYGSVQKLSLYLSGACERRGLGHLLSAIGKELLKSEADQGASLKFGYEPLDRDTRQSIEEKGAAGENALNHWFKSIGISYLYVNQSPQTFARLFGGTLKRPDFLVLLESVGLIAVDAKNYALYNNEYSLSLKRELKRVLTFERLFRIPVWYAYMSDEVGQHGTVWYWLSALKALEIGEIRQNSQTKEKFMTIDLSHFERIEKNEDLGKLYTHRLPSSWLRT